MELGLLTDSVRDSSLSDALDLAVEIGATGIEIAAGSQSPATHLSIDALLGDPRQLDAFRGALASRGLHLSALNCSSWPLHPVVGARDAELISRTLDLAERLGIRKIVTMSGCPGDGDGGTTINWIWSNWPEDGVALLARQWDQAIPFWQEMSRRATEHGVDKIAFELHPLNLVYNVPTLRRMREAVGPIIGANLDPSHLFWQQMDPLAVIRTLGDAIYHVHLKDTQLEPSRVAIAGVLDQGGGGHAERAWNFRTVGIGHDEGFWSAFIAELRAVGYDGVLSIENEDPFQAAEEGVRDAAAFIRPLLAMASAADPVAMGLGEVQRW
jgi:sugar phosphate isomerase/epimerase